MKNSYIIVGAIVIVAIVAFVIGSKKTEAPEILGQNNGEWSTTLPDGVYKVDPARSIVRWRGEYINGSSEKGTLVVSSGEATVAGGSLVAGAFEFDMTSIKHLEGNAMLENYLKSENFFDTEKYPAAKFTLKKFLPSSEDGAKLGRYTVAGDATLKGAVNPISLPAVIVSSGDEIMASSTFAVNRTEWGVNYNSPSLFENLGDQAIRDAILIEFEIVAVKEQ